MQPRHSSDITRLSDSDVVTRTGDFFVSRRQGRCLVVAPEFGRFLVMEPEYWRIFSFLEKPRIFFDVVKAFPDLGRRMVEPFLQQLHVAGLVRLRGREYRAGAPWRQVLAAPTFVALHLGGECNFRCSYCYAPAGAHQGRMTAETASHIVERHLASLPGDALSVDFLGGEPLLNFDVMVHVMETVRRTVRKSVSFMLQTNGSLLDAEKVEILNKFNVGVGVSIDGPPEIHDRFRLDASGAGTHARVFENMLRAREMGLKVAPLAVIHEPEHYMPVLEFFLRHGFDFIRLNYSSCLGRAKERLDFGHGRAEEFAQAFLAMAKAAHRHARKTGTALKVFDLTHYLGNLTQSRRGYMCLKSPCGAGENIVSFGSAGDLYVCEEYDERTRDVMRLGRPGDEGLVPFLKRSARLAEFRARTVERIPRCSRCPFRSVCCGGCAHKALAAFGDLMREDPMCRFYQVVFEELMWLVSDTPAIVRSLGG